MCRNLQEASVQFGRAAALGCVLLTSLLIPAQFPRAATLVIYLPADFPAVCAQDLSNGRSMCPSGVTATADDFCSAGLTRLPIQAGWFGANGCGVASSSGMPEEAELVLLIDDRNLKESLRSTIESVVESSGGHSVVTATHGVYRNRSGSVVRDTIIIGEASTSISAMASGGQSGSTSSDSRDGAAGSPAKPPDAAGNQEYSYATNYVYEPHSCAIFINEEVICSQLGADEGPIDQHTKYRIEDLNCPYVEGLTICLSRGILDFSVTGGENITDLECRIDWRKRVSCINPGAGSGHRDFDTDPPDSSSPQVSDESPRPQTRQRNSHQAGGSGSASRSNPAADQRSLRVVGRDRGWFVLNRDAFFAEVANLVWGDAFAPTHNQLYSRRDDLRTADGHVLENNDTHWAIARLFESYNDAPGARNIRPEFSRALQSATELTGPEEIMADARPRWIPRDVWEAAVSRWLAGDDGVRVHAGKSPARTAIVMIVRNGAISAYANQIDDAARLRTLTNIVPANRLQEITGESSAQASIRWLAEANREYNESMLRDFRRGISVQQEHRNYQNEVHRRLVTTIIDAFADHVPLAGSVNKQIETALQAWQFATWVRDHT